MKEGQPRRFKNATLPSRDRRGEGRSDNGVSANEGQCYDLPHLAPAKVALHLLEGLGDPSLRRGYFRNSAFVSHRAGVRVTMMD
jgi:hypothetical protein